ncbi:MAG TPA: AMP-dependent synthetase, partial [Thiotrichales bacterium]|nr:AMP-dependent synthetase [Thiotrichales bacterium]
MDNRPVVVAYVVPASISPPAAMAFTLKDFLADFHHPDLDNALPQAYADALNGISLDTVQIVLLNALPRDQHGSIDENALFALPVLDTGLIENWSRAIRKLSTIEDAVVLATLAHRKPGSLHRNDILKGLDPEGEAAVLAESSHVETEQPRANNLPDEETPEPGKKAKAIVHAAGQVLTDRLDEHHDLNLTSMLRRAAEQSPEKGIVYIDAAGDEQFQPYPQLLQEAETMLAGLLAQGIKAGDKVLLQCEDNRDFLNVFWACILGAMVPVPLSIAPDYTLDNAVVQKLFNVWQSLDQPVVVCSDNLTDEIIRVAAQLGGSSAAMAKKLLGVKSLQQHGKNTDRATCTGIEQPPGQLTLLLLTSGSTGTPKAVMHTHQTLINRCAATSVANHFGPEDISLNWMPLDHVGGIVMFHLRDVYNTCQQIQVATSWVLEQPLRWLDIIEDKHATVSWAPNFAYALIVDQATTLARQQRDLSSMRFFLNGGEPVVPRTASLFLKLLEPHQLAGDSMHPAWGMSETASAACYSDHFSTGSVTAAGAFVAVGAPIPNTAIRIVDRNNQ